MMYLELAGGVPALHPERKGQLNLSPLKNWIEKHGGLPTYINSVATALLRVHPEWGISRIIATAVNWAKKVCSTGRAFGGRVKVSKAVQAAACTAVAQWERKKAAASDDFDAVIVAADDYNNSLRRTLAQQRIELREDKKPIEKWMLASDYEYFRFACGMDNDTWTLTENEGVEDAMLDPDRFMQLVETQVYANAMIRYPLLSLTEAQHVGGNLYRKEIARTGIIKMRDKTTGTVRKLELTKAFLQKLKENHENNVAELQYLPLQFVDKDNNHSDDPRLYAGEVKRLSLADDGERLYADFEVTEDAQKAITNANFKVGASIKAYQNYAEGDTEHGPVLVHVAMTPREKLKGMAAWEPIAASEEDDTIDLTEAVFEDNDTQEDENMADDKKAAKNDNGVVEQTDDKSTPAFELTEDTIKEIFASEVGKNIIEAAVSEATKPLEQENEKLRGAVGTIQSKNFAQSVEFAVDSYANKGVTVPVRELVKELMLTFENDGDNDAITLTEGEGDNKKDVQVSRIELATKILDECEGMVNMTAEQGSEEDDAANVLGLTDEGRKNAVAFLTGKGQENNS